MTGLASVSVSAHGRCKENRDLIGELCSQPALIFSDSRTLANSYTPQVPLFCKMGNFTPHRAAIKKKKLSFFPHDFLGMITTAFSFVSWDILSSKNAHIKASEMPEANQFILTLTDF